MSTPRSSSPSRRLIVGLVLVALLILFNLSLFGWLIFRSLSAQELNEILTQTRVEAEGLAEELAGAADDDDLLSAIVRRQEAQTYIDRVLSKREIVWSVSIYDRDGAMLYETKETQTEVGDPVESAGDEPQEAFTRIIESETPYDIIDPPMALIEVPVGKIGSLVIGLSQPELDRRVQVLGSQLVRQALPMAILTLILLVSAYVGILWLLRRGQRLEERALEAERMAYIGTLASGLAHEIRSPLNSLSLNMQMLEEDVESGNSASRRRLLAITQSEITRLESLVTDFLSYARPRLLERLPVPAFDLLERLREVVAAEMQAEGIELVLTDRTRGERVSVDLDQMNQLLLNLTRNAISALGDRREEARIELRVESDGPRVLLTVEDNGVGMSSEEREKVFDLFYSTRKGGTGLGLAIARRIARAHGAELEIHSSPDEGTIVSLRLEAVVEKPQTRGVVRRNEAAAV